MSSPEQKPAALHFVAVAAMFILSGASALVYEVLWTRSLTTYFGASLFAVATVLSCFMGGLALGSWLLGKRADRMTRPLFVYGALEIGIGLAALAFPYLLKLTGPIVGSFYTTGGTGTFYFFSLVRFVIVFVLLLIPTTMMGATLPILSRALARREDRIGRAVGGLYALNTVGACLGVFLAGFFLIERFGLQGAKHIAVLVNVAVGLLAMALGSRHFNVAAEPRAERSAEPASAIPAEDRRLRSMILLCYGFSGFAALALQVCWTRSLVFSFETLKNTTYSFSGMLLVFLIGLATGSALMQAFVDKQRNLLRLFGVIQCGIAFGAAGSLLLIAAVTPLLKEFDAAGDYRWWAAVANVLLKTGTAIFLPTFLMGVAFPVVTRLFVRGRAGLGSDVGRLYAANTLGAIFGSFGAGFVLIPVMGIAKTALLMVLIYLCIGVLFLLRDREGGPASRKLAMVVAVLGLLAVLRVHSAVAKLPVQRIQFDESLVYYEEGPVSTVSVIENKAGDRTIFIDDVPVAGTDKILQTDQKSLAHAPMMLLGGEATRVLTVGFGAGGASWSYTQYPGIEEIHAIEISPEVLDAAKTLTGANHGIIFSDKVIGDARAAGAVRITGAAHPLDAYTHTPVPGFKTFDPRYRVLVDDARAYLRFTDLKYDVIATDCTDLRYKSNANLYDLEYFTLCREHLTERGLVVVWMPLAGLSDRAFRCALRTFEAVFPQNTVWYFPNQPTHYILLIGGNGPLRMDYEEIRTGTEMPFIQADLESIGLRDPEKLLSCFVADERSLRAYLGDGPLNTENTPIIEFESPRYGYGNQPLTDNMRSLYAIQVPVWDLLSNVPDPEKTKDRLSRLQQANEIIFDGHVAYREFDFIESYRKYRAALDLVPDDASTMQLLEYEEARAIIGRAETLDSNVVWLTHSVGSIFLLEGRFSDAVTLVEPLVGRLPGPSPELPREVREGARALNLLLSRIYEAAGQLGRARDFYHAALRYDPSLPPWESRSAVST